MKTVKDIAQLTIGRFYRFEKKRGFKGSWVVSLDDR